MTIKHTCAALLVTLPLALPPTAPAAPPPYDYNTGAQTAWDAGFTGHGVNVAVIDTGIDSSNPWIKDQVIQEACLSTEGTAGVLPFCGGPDRTAVWGPLVGPGAAMPSVAYRQYMVGSAHGTSVAGVVAGAEQRVDGEPQGWRGMAPDAGLIGINAAGANAKGDAVLYLTQPLEWLDAHRAELDLGVVNISAGSPNDDVDRPCDNHLDDAHKRERAAIYALIDHGVSVVASAGNEPTRTLTYPACLSRVISVSGVRSDTGRMSSKVSRSSRITVLAPSDGVRGPSMFTGTTRTEVGTSFAAPLVSGAIALYLQRHPGASPATVKQALQDTGVPVRVRRGLVKPRLQVDALLGLDEDATGTVNDKCLKAEFYAVPGRPGRYEGGLRILCRPSAGDPSRVAVVIDGPNVSKTANFDNVTLKSNRFYRVNTVRFTAAVSNAKSGTYRTCFLYYGTEDDVWPVAKDCRYDDV